jgi:hypothetical protein
MLREKNFIVELLKVNDLKKKKRKKKEEKENAMMIKS